MAVKTATKPWTARDERKTEGMSNPPVVSSQNTTYDSFYDSQVVVKFPGRFQFGAVNGYLPVNNYDRTYVTREKKLGKVIYQAPRWMWNGQWVRDVFTQDNDHFVAAFDNDAPRTSIEDARFLSLESSAIARMNSEVRSQSMSVFETVFEGRKTVELILATLARMVSSARAARRGDMGGAARHLGVSWTKRKPAGGLSDRWLALRYGWQPLCYEVYGALEGTYNAMKLYPGLVQHAKGQAKISIVKGYPVHQEYGNGTSYPHSGSVSYPSLVRLAVDSSEDDILQAQAFCVYRITNPTLAASTMFGLSNPLLVGWELLPLSFVADWFVNVSDVLGQLDAWTGKQYLTGGVTRTFKSTRTAKSSYVSIQSGYTLGSFKSASSTLRHVTTRRRVFANPPLVQPQYFAQLNLKRVVDAVALAKQIIR